MAGHVEVGGTRVITLLPAEGGGHVRLGGVRTNTLMRADGTPGHVRIGGVRVSTLMTAAVKYGLLLEAIPVARQQYGLVVQMTASVQPSPGAVGTVEFFIDGVSEDVVNVGGDGTATIYVSDMEVGDHVLHATWDEWGAL